MRKLLLPAAGALAILSAFSLQGQPPAPAPMPPATPTPAGPHSPAPPGVIKSTRVEIVDTAGRVSTVLTTENGVPIAIVNDAGAARRIDLAKVARMVK